MNPSGARLAVGISGFAAYLPCYRVNLEDWCRWTGDSWGKVSSIVGRSFRMRGAGRERLHDGGHRRAAADPGLRHRPAPRRLSRARHRVEHRQFDRRGHRQRHGQRRAACARRPAACAPLRGSRVQTRVPRRRVCDEGGRCATWHSTARTSSRSSCAPTSPSTRAARPASRRKAPAPSRCCSKRNRSCSTFDLARGGSAS